MTSLNVIENKISFIKNQLKILKIYQKLALKKIAYDSTLKGAVERYLYLVSQATIDLAEAVISYKDFRKPTTYSENFDILCEEKIISRPMAERLIKMAGFRNRIAHAYENLNFVTVYNVLKNNLNDIHRFIEIINKKLRL